MNILLVTERAGMPLPGVRLSGSESISQLFRFEVDVVQGFPIKGLAGALLDTMGLGSAPTVVNIAGGTVAIN